MKKSSLIVSALAITAIVGALTFNATQASQDDEKMATKAVQEYVTGFKNGDIGTMIKYIKDTRVTDPAQLKEQYEYYVKQNKDRSTDLKFVSIEKVNGERYAANFEMSSKEFKATPFQLPVIKENGEWKILVDGSVTLKTNK